RPTWRAGPVSLSPPSKSSRPRQSPGPTAPWVAQSPGCRTPRPWSTAIRWCSWPMAGPMTTTPARMESPSSAPPTRRTADGTSCPHPGSIAEQRARGALSRGAPLASIRCRLVADRDQGPAECAGAVSVEKDTQFLFTGTRPGDPDGRRRPRRHRRGSRVDLERPTGRTAHVPQVVGVANRSARDLPSVDMQRVVAVRRVDQVDLLFGTRCGARCDHAATTTQIEVEVDICRGGEVIGRQSDLQVRRSGQAELVLDHTVAHPTTGEALVRVVGHGVGSARVGGETDSCDLERAVVPDGYRDLTRTALAAEL